MTIHRRSKDAIAATLLVLPAASIGLALAAGPRSELRIAARVSPFARPATGLSRTAFEARPWEQSTGQGATAKPGAPKPALAPSTKIASERMDVVLSASDEAIAPGSRVSLVFDFTPKRNIHVYAPGNENYIPLSLKIEPQGLLQVHPAQFPPAEDYLFKPLNERVKVYQKPFKVVQDLTVDKTPQAMAALKDKTSVTVTGTIDYQACDEKICFNPVTVPVSWTFKIRPADQNRRP
jgi:hypothetical protein